MALLLAGLELGFFQTTALVHRDRGKARFAEALFPSHFLFSRTLEFPSNVDFKV